MDFLTKADAGAPLSLRFLVFDLDLVAVQVMARERIKAGGPNGALPRKMCLVTRT